MSRMIGSPYQKTLASTTPSSSPPRIAPGSEPIPPSIIAIKPFENDPAWHARKVKGEELEIGKKELGLV